MIVDCILDRKDGTRYNVREFYHYCLGYMGGLGDEITQAMDGGTNADVQEALCWYIAEQQYGLDICEFIRSKNWIEDDPLNPMCADCKRLGVSCGGTAEMSWTGCAGKNQV